MKISFVRGPCSGHLGWGFGGYVVIVVFEWGGVGGGKCVKDQESGEEVTGWEICSVQWCLFGAYFGLGLFQGVPILQCIEHFC